VIAAGRLQSIDLGFVNDHPFFNVASIGLSVELTQSLTKDLKQRWGRAGYAVAGMRVLARARRFSAWITEGDETTRVRTLQIAIGNGRHYGGGNVVEETAAIDDGRLDLYSLEMSSVWKLAFGLRTFRSGAHGAWTDVRTAAASSSRSGRASPAT
jgi:diacylglycerol kinase family enzyme